MPIELAGVKLNKINTIQTLEKADFVYHDVPGLNGSLAQDIGRSSVKIEIKGICYGNSAKDDLQVIRDLYLKRKEADFIADIVGKSYAAKVLIDRLEVMQSAYNPDQFDYIFVIAEYAKPAKKSYLDSITSKIQSKAKALVNIVNLPKSLSFGSIPELSNPFKPLNEAVAPFKEAADAFVLVLNGFKSVF